MSAEPELHDELQALMTQALDICLQLQTYSDDSFHLFLEDDDDQILKMIEHREVFIDQLVAIEGRIDMILESVCEYKKGRTLPDDIDEVRQSVRRVLKEVRVKDFEMMKIVSCKMQTYKTETLKVRNKSNISAYLQTPLVNQSGDSIDFLK